MPERKRHSRRSRRISQGVEPKKVAQVAFVVGLGAALVGLGVNAADQSRREGITSQFVLRATGLLGIDCQSTSEQEYARVMHDLTVNPAVLGGADTGSLTVVNGRGQEVALTFSADGEFAEMAGETRVEYPTENLSASEYREGPYGIRVYGSPELTGNFDRFFDDKAGDVSGFLRDYFEGFSEGELHVNYTGVNVDTPFINDNEVSWLLDLGLQAAVQTYTRTTDDQSFRGALVQMNAQPMHVSAVNRGYDLSGKVIEALVNERVGMLSNLLRSGDPAGNSELASTIMGMVAANDPQCARLGLNTNPGNPLINKMAEMMADQGRVQR